MWYLACIWYICVCVLCFCLLFDSCFTKHISEMKILMFLLQCCWSFWSSRREVQPPHLLTATQHNSQSFGKKCWTVQGSVTTNFLRTLHSKWTASLHMHDFAEGIISWSSMLGVSWLPPLPPTPTPPHLPPLKQIKTASNGFFSLRWWCRLFQGSH